MIPDNPDQPGPDHGPPEAGRDGTPGAHGSNHAWRLLLIGASHAEALAREIETSLGRRHAIVRTEPAERAGAAAFDGDAILLLLHEPVEPGLQLLARIQSSAPHVPIVAVLPSALAHLTTLAIQQGAQDALVRDPQRAGEEPDEAIASNLESVIRKAIERVRRIARLELEVAHDELTGLPRRRRFLHHVAEEIERSRRDPSHRFAIVLVNLDRFKLINDSLGPTYGDQLLVALARRMSRCLRPHDVIARLGGGEFAILVRRLESETHGPSLCQSLQRETTAPFVFGGNEVFTTATLGIVTNLVPYDDPDDLLRDAGIALHSAKDEGNGRYRVYEPGLHATAKLRFRREMELRQSIAQKDFRLFYQPIIDLQTGTLEGFEALLRWEHPVEGMISPDQFIPIAEETGLIIPIERWVLRHGCDQLRQWRRQLPPERGLHLHINLSGKHLSRPELASELGSIVREMEIDPQWICLEITESSIVENHDDAMELLHRMRDLGCTLSIDDFGTGYSSLSCLKTYPLDTLKIDRSFIDEMGETDESLLLVRSILGLAHGFGLDTVAEGIETPEQLRSLRDLGCTRGQGYLISRPVDRARATEIVAGAAHGGSLIPKLKERKVA